MNLLKRSDFDSQEELYDFVMENNKEEWFLELENGDYIGSHGTIISKKNKIRKPFIKDGYYKIGFKWTDCKSKNFFIHRLVAINFIPNDDTENKTQVDHKDSDRMNNDVANLRWVTPEENRANPNSVHNFKICFNEVVGVHDDGSIIHVDFLADLKQYGFNANDINIISKCCKGEVITSSVEEDDNGIKIIKTTTIDYSNHTYKGFTWNYVERKGRKRAKQKVNKK